jgi:hypothetical protein
MPHNLDTVDEYSTISRFHELDVVGETTYVHSWCVWVSWNPLSWPDPSYVCRRVSRFSNLFLHFQTEYRIDRSYNIQNY